MLLLFINNQPIIYYKITFNINYYKFLFIKIKVLYNYNINNYKILFIIKLMIY